MTRKTLVYLASPYSLYPGGRQEAYALVCKKAGDLMKSGYSIFCPIAHSHAIEAYMPEIQSGEWWLEQDFAVLQRCKDLFVYKMPGWEKSVGVQAEIEFAKKNYIPISYIEYESTPEVKAA